jgi:factor associated with neutral sphingomyelinase activation
VITTGHDGCIKVVGLDTLQKRSFTVCDLALSSSAVVDSSKVVAGSYDNKVYLFSIGTGRVQDAVGEHDDAVTCVQYIPALNAAVSSSWDAYTRLWDIRGNKLHCAAAFEDHEEQITSMSADPLGDNPYQIVTGDLDGKIVIRDLRAGKVLSRFQAHSHISSIAYSMFSKHLVVSTPNFVSLYDYDGREAEVLNIPGVSSLATDGIFVLTGKEEGNLELWSMMKGNCMYAWRNIGTVTSVASDAYGESFFAGTLDGMLYYIP